MERDWMNRANLEDQSGRREMAELIRDHIGDIQAARNDRPPKKKDRAAVRDMKWEGRTR
jgi:hypothetical protein